MKKYLTDDEVKIKLHEREFQTVALNYVNLACYIADRYARRSMTHEKEDIRSVALLTMVEAVYRLSGHPNPMAFLRVRIKGAVINYCVRDNTIYRPQGTERAEKWLYLEDVPGDKEDLSLPKEYWSPFDPDERLVRARIFDSILLSVLEKEMITLRLEGLTIEEIAVLCQRPWVQVQRIIAGVKVRVENILYEVY